MAIPFQKITMLAGFIFVGLILIPMPVPVGIFFIIGGLVMLLSVDPNAHTQPINLRKKHRWKDNILDKVTKKSPSFVKPILSKTR